MDGEQRRRRTRNRGGSSAATPSSGYASPDAAASADRSGGVRATGAGIGAVYDTPVHFTGDDRDGERGLRGLVGGGGTQVSISAALRARDASRPTDEDLAAAEGSMTIVHRGWTPRS